MNQLQQVTEALAEVLEFQSSPKSPTIRDWGRWRRAEIAARAALAAPPLGAPPAGSGSPLQPAVSAAIPSADVTPGQLYEAIAAEYSDDGVPWARQKGDLRRAYRTYASIINMWHRHFARGIEREAREPAGPSPTGDEPGGEATRPQESASPAPQPASQSAAAVLREVRDWDHRGDSVQERYDELHGDGVYDAAIASAPQPASQPVHVEAVAEVVRRDDELRLDWLIEGGIAALPEGVVLIASDRPITDDNGAGEVYTAPQPAEPPAGWVLVPREPTPEMVEAICEAHAASGT